MLNVFELDRLEVFSKQTYGSCNRSILDGMNVVLGKAFEEYSRLFIVRFDLRFANPYLLGVDSPSCFQYNDQAVISRFIEAVKSRFKADDNRKVKHGIRLYGNRLRYAWVREQDSLNPFQHYHVVFYLNRDRWFSLGDYGENSRHLAGLIQKAWCSAIGLPYPHFGNLVHWLVAGSYHLDKREALSRGPVFAEVNQRLAYFSKTESKPNTEGIRTFGSSND